VTASPINADPGAIEVTGPRQDRHSAPFHADYRASYGPIRMFYRIDLPPRDGSR
jgi:hypothetical protein